MSLSAHHFGLVFAFAGASALGGCVIGGQIRKEVTDIAAVAAHEVVLVGEIQLRPPFQKDEQRVQFASLDILNVADMHRGRAWIYVEKKPELNKEYVISMNPKLDQTFFISVSKETPYIVGGGITARLYHKYVGSRMLGGQLHADYEEVYNRIDLPACFKIDILPGDKAVYIGTIRYSRDESNSVKQVDVVDEYERAAADFRAKFGGKYELRKAIATKIAVAPGSAGGPVLPDSADAWIDRGMKFYRAEQYERAEEAMERAVAREPANARAYYYRGVARVPLEKRELAMGDFNRAIELDPNLAGAYQDRAALRHDAGDIEGALRDCDRAIQLNRRSALAYTLRAGSRRRSGDAKGAIEDLDRALELEPSNRSALFVRGCLQYDGGSWVGAEADFGTVFKSGATLRDYAAMRLWVVRARTGRRDTADAELRKYLAQRREPPEREEWEEAILTFLAGALTEEELLRRTSSERAGVAEGRRCQAWFFAGVRRLVEGNNAAARACLEKSIATGRADFSEHASASAELRRLSGGK